MNNESKSAVSLAEPDKIWNAAFISLFFVNLSFNMGQNMSNSLLAIYADHLGASSVAVGFVLSAFAVSALFFHCIASPIMDTYNRKYIIIISSIIVFLAFVGFSRSRSVPALITFRLLQGCGMAFGNACSIAMVSDMIPRDKYGAGIGYFSISTVISQAIGPSFGLWLVDAVGFQITFVVNACFMLLSAFLALQLKLNFKRTKKLIISFSNIIAKEVIIPTILLLFIVTTVAFGNAFLILHAANQGVKTNIGLYFTVNAVTILATRTFAGKLMDKYGAVKVVLPALAFNVIACFMTAFSTTLWHFIATAAVNALGTGVCQPAFQTLSMKSVASDRRGSASCTNFLGMDVASLVGPILGGVVVEKFGYSIGFCFQAIPFVLCMVVLFICRGWVYKTEVGFAQPDTAK